MGILGMAPIMARRRFDGGNTEARSTTTINFSKATWNKQAAVERQQGRDLQQPSAPTLSKQNLSQEQLRCLFWGTDNKDSNMGSAEVTPAGSHVRRLMQMRSQDHNREEQRKR